MSNQVALQKRITDVIEEYNEKCDNVKQAIQDFKDAQDKIISAATVSGTWGRTSLQTGNVHEREILSSLLKSAWQNIYDGLNIAQIASAKDKKQFEQTIESPPPFTIDNLRSSFADYLMDPRGNILRGLAEVFYNLDDAYLSHDRMKIGVKGLPKRVIISNVDSIYGYGKDKIQDILNALAAYQGKPLVSYVELNALMENEDALQKEWKHYDSYSKEEHIYPARGVRLRRFMNGNGHLFFDKKELNDINMALAEYYGEVLADCPEERLKKKQQSTAVSKDLQYYPTPSIVIDNIVDYMCYVPRTGKVLEPSCGCGRILDSLSKHRPDLELFGVEVDAGRAQQCKEKGYSVLNTNFLETEPQPIYDMVVMNPPFYGKHYAKHVEHAKKFLKDDGTLIAILPVTARTDHGLLDGKWNDLPLGSFKESGTNINTTVLITGKK